MSLMRRISYILILCLSILFVQAKDFRFALFTDLHITHSTPAVEDLQRAVDQVNATSGIDFVLVSGDITEEGDLASLQKAKSILDKLKVTYYITSGNHETNGASPAVPISTRYSGPIAFDSNTTDTCSRI
jgi:Predicted phosphohydrolases